MFWHISRALDLDYWLIPVPNSYWTQLEMEVPVNDILAVAKKALYGDAQVWHFRILLKEEGRKEALPEMVSPAHTDWYF